MKKKRKRALALLAVFLCLTVWAASGPGLAAGPETGFGFPGAIGNSGTENLPQPMSEAEEMPEPAMVVPAAAMAPDWAASDDPGAGGDDGTAGASMEVPAGESSEEYAGETGITPDGPPDGAGEAPGGEPGEEPGSAGDALTEDQTEDTPAERTEDEAPESPEETGEEDPAETEPENPGEAESDSPAETEPENPGEAEPDSPAETEPENPGEAEPDSPAETGPDSPGEAEPEGTESDSPEETEPEDPEAAEPESAAEEPTEENSTVRELSPEDMTPSELVAESDLRRILGDGVDEEIDPSVDAVAVILAKNREDEGLRQMAAEKSGKTEEAAAAAAAAILEGDVPVPKEIVDSALNAGIVDESEMSRDSLLGKASALLTADVYADELPGNRTEGRGIDFVPAPTKAESMCYLSDFVLAKKRDGTGDWDEESDLSDEEGTKAEGYDFRGHDLSDANHVVRTNDDVIYTLCYATALNDAYLYNTIRGVRLYVSYTLPVGPEMASFHLEAMPWLKDPVVVSGDGTQTLTGYRALPDTEAVLGDGTRELYSVPGAGTVNCVVSIHDMENRSSLKPSFRAWIALTDNTVIPDAENGMREADQGNVTSEVSITCAPYVELSFRLAPVTLSFYRELEAHFNPEDWTETRREKGRLKNFNFYLRAAKPGGSDKGISRIDTSRPIRVAFALENTGNPDLPGDAGLYDVRTHEMTDGETGLPSGAIHPGTVTRSDDGGPDMYATVRTFNGSGSSYSTADAAARGTGKITGYRDDGTGSIGCTSEGGRSFFFFEIDPAGITRTGAGELLSFGHIMTFQKQEKMNGQLPEYSLKIQGIHVTAYDRMSGELCVFDQPGAHMTSSNQITGEGSWNVWLYPSHGRRGSGFYTTSSQSTDGNIGYGADFFLMSDGGRTPSETNPRIEKSRYTWILWDGVTTEPYLMPSTGLPYVTGYNDAFRVAWITRGNGEAFASEEEMKESSDIALGRMNAEDFSVCGGDLLYFSSYEEACRSGTVVGALVATYDFVQETGTRSEFGLTIRMKTKENPGIIGDTAVFTQSLVTFDDDSAKRYDYAAESARQRSGERPVPPPSFDGEHAVLTRNLFPAERDYRATRYDEGGVADPDSMTAENTAMKGTSLHIDGYDLVVREYAGELGEQTVVTEDTASLQKVLFRTCVSLETAAETVSGAGGTILLPQAACSGTAGNPLKQATHYVLDAKGEKVILVPGSSYEIAALTGGSGTVEVLPEGDPDSEESLRPYYNGDEPSLDRYAGRTFRLHPADDPGLSLGVSGRSASAADLCVSADDEEDPFQLWTFAGEGGGIYLIRNVGAKRYAGRAANLVQEGNTVRTASSSSSYSGSIRWKIREGNGGVVIGIPASGLCMAPERGGPEAPVVFAAEDGGPLSRSWIPEEYGNEGAPAGTALRVTGLRSGEEIPVIYTEYEFDRSALLEGSGILGTAVVLPENDRKPATAENRHLATANYRFTAIYGNAVKETVSTPEEDGEGYVRNGHEITYTVTYTNIYDDTEGGHSLEDPSHRIVIEVPRAGMDGTELREGAELTYVEGSARVTSSGGSSTLSVSESGGTITAHGVLSSGETVTVTYRVLVTGAGEGDVIRSRSKVDDPFGSYDSNFVETRVRNDGWLMIRKVPADPRMAEDPDLDLSGAVYGVYRDSGCASPYEDGNGAAVTLVTGKDGASGTAELEPGVYYLREDITPAGFGTDETMRTGRKFEISADNWKDNPLVIRSEEPVIPPAIRKTVAEEEVMLASFGQRETFPWTIHADVPAGFRAGGSRQSRYGFTDVIDSRLEYRENVRVTVDGVPLAAEEFTVTFSEAEGMQTLQIEFTGSGKEKLEAAGGKEDAVTVRYDTAIREGTAAAERIPNHAVLHYTQYGTEGETENPEDPEVYTGEIRILKLDGETDRPLEGVTFALFRDRECTAEERSLVTGRDGLAVFSGVADGTWYLKETKTTGGRSLLKDVIAAEVKDGTVDGGKTIRVRDHADLILVTGGSGVFLFRLIGLILLFDAAFLIIRARRREERT